MVWGQWLVTTKRLVTTNGIQQVYCLWKQTKRIFDYQLEGCIDALMYCLQKGFQVLLYNTQEESKRGPFGPISELGAFLGHVGQSILGPDFMHIELFQDTIARMQSI